MKFSSTLALASIAIGVQSQGAPPGLAPAGGSPPGCIATGTGRYAVQNQMTPSKRSLQPRLVDCSNPDALVVTLNNGILIDSHQRIGEIVKNRQFQFDGPPAQTGTIYDAGWSLCPNGTLAIGPTTVFYSCKSGNFYNTYDQPVGAQCMLIHQAMLPCADNVGTTSAAVSSPTTTAVAATSPASTSVAAPPATVTSAVSQASDGQPQASSAVAVSQISDGQPQASSAANGTVTSATPSASAVPTGGAVSFGVSGALAAVGAAAALLL